MLFSSRSWDGLPRAGFPCVFHGLVGVDKREGRSPSFFNTEEVVVVVDYLDKLLNGRGRHKVSRAGDAGRSRHAFQLLARRGGGRKGGDACRTGWSKRLFHYTTHCPPPSPPLSPLQVQPKDVAVISPYRRQVQKVRELMRRKFGGVRGLDHTRSGQFGTF